MTDTKGDGQTYSARIAETNPELENLKLSWRTPKYSDEDGLGPMESMHEAGSSLIAVSKETPDGPTIIGSGVMVAPGLLLTATHVLDDFKESGHGPVFVSFLPNGPRVWLPHASATVSGESEFDPGRKIVSDISLVSCTLNSKAIEDESLMLTPVRVALPLIGQRLWAFGFRHQHIEDNIPSVTPFVASGRVSGAFPDGRGERMPAPCIEVDMDTLGGMSGGPVVNDEGEMIGILSSSFEGGPSYVTLIWDALRMKVKAPPGRFERFEEISLMSASQLLAARVLGEVQRKPWGDVIVKLSKEEGDLFELSKVQSTKGDPLPADVHNLSSVRVDEFAERYDELLEEFVEEAAEAALLELPLETGLPFLKADDVPAILLDAITRVKAEVFEGLEDFNIISIRDEGTGLLRLRCYFHLRRVAWIATVPKQTYDVLAKSFDEKFFLAQAHSNTVDLELIQRCVFQAEIYFEPEAETFNSFKLIWCGVRRRKKQAL